MHMKRYSICINNTFCLFLDENNLIDPQIPQECGYFNEQNILNLSKMYRLKYRVIKMNDTIYVSYSQSMDTTDILWYDTEPSMSSTQ